MDKTTTKAMTKIAIAVILVIAGVEVGKSGKDDLNKSNSLI